MEPWWMSPLRETFAGRRVLIVGGRPQMFVDYVDDLRSFGVEEIFLLATEGEGVGPAPDVPTLALDPPEGLSMMEAIRHSNAVLNDLPPDALAALAEFDPDRSAIPVGSFLLEAADVDGRSLLAYRRPEWVALEDKTIVDAFWDAARVERVPSAVVPLSEAAAVESQFDEGAGTVWAADSRDGYHGGATGTFWVVDDDARASAGEALSPICDKVRVMPFLEGVPCSIHGIVLPDGTAVLRPVELVTLRQGTDLKYAGCATFWDPAPEVRDQMRDVARRVGELLRAQVGFRGAFTVDGVAGEQGFRPTELNPRFGMGIMTIARAAGLPIVLLNDLIVGGREIGRTAADLEAELVASADDNRGGGTWMPGAQPTVEVDSRDVAETDGVFAWAGDGDRVAGTLAAGPGFARCIFTSDSVRTGPSVAPRAVALWDFVDRELGTALGPLTAAGS